MTRMTWDQAVQDVLQRSTDPDTAYTLGSQDQLWTVFIFDSWSSDHMRGATLFFIDENRRMSYDLFGDAIVFNYRAEADEFRDKLQALYDNETTSEREPVVVYTINVGDHARWNQSVRDGAPITEGKFAGSDLALEALTGRYEADR